MNLHRFVEGRGPVDFTSYPLAQIAIGFASGVFAQSLVAGRAALWMSAAIICAACAALVLIPKKQPLASTLVLMAFVFLGGGLAAIEKAEAPANQIKRLIADGRIKVGEAVELTGVLQREPESAPGRRYAQLNVETIRVRNTEEEFSTISVVGSVALLIALPNPEMEAKLNALNLHYGTRVRVVTRLERTDNFRNPGVSSFTEYLDRQGHDASGFVRSPLSIERLDDARVFPPLAWLYRARAKLQRQIEAHFSPETVGVLEAAFLGNRYRLSRATADRFREGGTFHALVISGLHITFLGGLVFLVVRRFTKNKKLQFGVSATVLWAYSLAVGAESSVTRAALMFTIAVFAPLVARRASSLNVMGGAALMLLALRPSDLFDPSFQLTFVSVLALVLIAWPIIERARAIGSWLPTRQTPYPPRCASSLRAFCECLFWRESEGKRELDRASYSYQLFKSPFAKTLERFHLQRALRYSFAAIVVSAGVQLALLPFLVVYFHRVSIASLVLNIGVSVIMAAVAFCAAVALLVAQFSAVLAAPLIKLTDGLNWLMVHSVDPFAKLGLASIRLPEYSGRAALMYALYYVPLAWLAVALAHWNPLNLAELAGSKSSLFTNRSLMRFAVVAQLALAGLIIFHPLSSGNTNGKLRIDFLDVGQGDSALVTFPDNTTLLIDGGGRPGPFTNVSTDTGNEEVTEREARSIGEAVVSEYLWWRGLDEIDYLLATHADADHIDGLNDIANNFTVNAALVARDPETDLEYARLAATLRNKSIPIYKVGAGDQLVFGKVDATVLWPMPAANLNVPSRNNDSIVLRIQFGKRLFLFTGDIESVGEQALSSSGADLRADVIKVAHHGSKTSSTQSFVNLGRPRFAIVSVGQTSMFGHPHAAVVERWSATKAHLLTTGNSGTITITTDGESLEVETFVK